MLAPDGVLVGAGLLASGIALEEAIAAQLALVPGLGALDGAVDAAIVSALPAFATCIAVMLLDRADLFGVVAEARATTVGAALDTRVTVATATAQNALTQLALTVQAL